MLEIDFAHAGLDEREGESGIEVEHVVRNAGRHLGDPAEHAAALLLDLETDELEGVVLALHRRRQRLARHGKVGAARRLAVEPDHRAAAGAALRHDDLRPLAVDVDDRADREPLQIVTGLLDEEGAVEAVRPSHTADAYKLSRRSRQGCGSSTAPRPPGRSEEHTSELQSQSNLVCRLLLE